MRLYERIAEALGWTLPQVQSMSAQSLRELVRPVNANLAAELTHSIASGAYVARRR